MVIKSFVIEVVSFAFVVDIIVAGGLFIAVDDATAVNV